MFILGSGDLVDCALQTPGVYIICVCVGGGGGGWWREGICADGSCCLHYYRD